MVMITAITPSVNASSRPLCIETSHKKASIRDCTGVIREILASNAQSTTAQRHRGHRDLVSR
jgi:hypothetical protein